MMNEKLVEMAKDSGFVFWQDEPHGPGPNNIDWSSEYNAELQGLYDRMVDKFIESVENSFRARTFTTYDAGLLGQLKKEMVTDMLKEFGK